MKSILFVALIVVLAAACDTPQPTATPPADTTKSATPTDTTTKKPDSTRQQ
jgi:hypothetical protein